MYYFKFEISVESFSFSSNFQGPLSFLSDPLLPISAFFYHLVRISFLSRMLVQKKKSTNEVERVVFPGRRHQCDPPTRGQRFQFEYNAVAFKSKSGPLDTTLGLLQFTVQGHASCRMFSELNSEIYLHRTMPAPGLTQLRAPILARAQLRRAGLSGVTSVSFSALLGFQIILVSQQLGVEAGTTPRLEAHCGAVKE